MIPATWIGTHRRGQGSIIGSRGSKGDEKRCPVNLRNPFALENSCSPGFLTWLLHLVSLSDCSRPTTPQFSGFVTKDFVKLGRTIPEHPSHIRVAKLAVDAKLPDPLQRFERVHPRLFGLFA